MRDLAKKLSYENLKLFTSFLFLPIKSIIFLLFIFNSLIVFTYSMPIHLFKKIKVKLISIFKPQKPSSSLLLLLPSKVLIKLDNLILINLIKFYKYQYIPTNQSIPLDCMDISHLIQLMDKAKLYYLLLPIHSFLNF